MSVSIKLKEDGCDFASCILEVRPHSLQDFLLFSRIVSKPLTCLLLRYIIIVIVVLLRGYQSPSFVKEYLSRRRI